MLDSIGMQWQGRADRTWDRNYRKALELFGKDGEAHIAPEMDTRAKTILKGWVYRQIELCKKGKLDNEKCELIKKLNICWDKKDWWTRGFERAREYYEEYGKLKPKCAYRSDDGFDLPQWLGRQRANKENLTEEQIRKLNSIGMEWRTDKEKRWDDMYDLAKAYYQKHGNLKKICMPENREKEKKLRNWVCDQKRERNRKRMTEERAIKLAEIGLYTKSV